MTGLDFASGRTNSPAGAAPAGLARLVDAVLRWRREEQTLRQLGRLSDRQLDDIGLSRAKLRETVRGLARR